MSAAATAPISWAQQPPQPPSGGGRRGTVITSPRTAYPDRPKGDPAAIARGRALYRVNCAFCHGADTRGGDSGPSLLRSSVVLDDQQGERIAPVVQNGRTDRGMPKFALTQEQVSDIAAFVHTFKVAAYDESRQRPPNIVVGDPNAGEAFFKRTCTRCHSATGDLQGVATRIADAKLLQQTWLMPGSGGGRGVPPAVAAPRETAIVTLAQGPKIEGTVDRLDDFVISLTVADGSHHSFTTGEITAVEIHDPLEAHRQLLRSYTDSDIHNVTAYLVTLK